MTNTLFIGWNRPQPGREKIAQEHFKEFATFLSKQKEAGLVESFEPTLLVAHGGDMNGFFLVRGTPEKLHELVRTEDWVNHMTRGTINMTNFGAVWGFHGSEVETAMKRYQRWI